MKNKLEEKFLDYLDGTLPELERTAMESALQKDPELRQSLEEYKEVVELEKVLLQDSAEASSGFETKVMNALEESRAGFLERLIMKMNVKQVAGGFATCAILMIGIKLAFDQRDELLSTVETRPVQIESGDTDGAGRLDESPAQVAVEQEPKPEADISKSVTLAPSRQERHIHLNNQPAPVMRSESSSASSGVVVNDLLGSRLSSKQHRSSPAYSGSGMEMDRSINSPGHHYSYMPYPHPHMNRRESYKDHGENPRIKTSVEAMSTFSIDVDTASYTNARRFLASGTLPPAEAIRTEEFLNYFDYNYPSQSEKAFALHYEIAPSPLEEGRHLLKLGVKARDRVEALENQKGWNLVFLVDVSGSMGSDDRLPLAKQALTILAKQMRPQDQIGIVTYAGTTTVTLEPTSGKEKDKILRAINSLQAAGGTYGSGGIQLAYEMAQRNVSDGSVSRVILATDGDFNVGMTSFEQLIRLIEEKRKSGVTLTTLGFGRGNLQDHLMEQLANKGNGNYFYIDSLREARKVLEHDLLSNIEVVASDVKLQIEFNPEHVIEYRLIGYENR